MLRSLFIARVARSEVFGTLRCTPRRSLYRTSRYAAVLKAHWKQQEFPAIGEVADRETATIVSISENLNYGCDITCSILSLHLRIVVKALTYYKKLAVVMGVPDAEKL